MALIGQSAGLLFKIDADASGAQRELRAVDAAVGRLGGQFTSFAGIAALGAAGIAAIGAAAVTASVAMFNLAKSTSEYGSEIFDATQKTGLGAEAISSLKIAAEQSGSSLEAVTRGITIFAKNYKGTSQDLQGELGKLFQQINDAKPGFEQLTLATKSFGKAGADLIPVIKSFKGDLPGLIAEMKRLGVTIDDEAARAADEFGDTLDRLTAQAAGTGRTFATQFMPEMTRAMNRISTAFVNNKEIVVEWGKIVGSVVRGISIIVESETFKIIANLAKWMAMLTAAGVALAAVFEIGKKDQGGLLTGQLSAGSFGQLGGPGLPFPTGGGRGGGRGGGGGADNAEAERRKAIQAAEDAMQRRIDIFRKTAEAAIAVEDEKFSRLEISETEHVEAVRSIRERTAQYEATQLSQFAKLDKLNNQEKLEAEHKLALAKKDVFIEQTKTSEAMSEDHKRQQKELDDEIEKLERLIELERQRQEAAAKSAFERRKQRLIIDAQEREDRINQSSIGGGFFGGLAGSIAVMANSTISAAEKIKISTESIGQSWKSMKATVGGAIDSLVQGIGDMIQNWILMGSTAPGAMRKLVATVLAGVAAQAAILAIFETAKGFAALFFNPAEAAAHFTAAALFGSIALGTGLAGRAMAGDLFNQQASGATGGGGGSSQGAGNQPALNFTSPFAGFQDRANVVLGGVADALDRFNEKFGMASPGHVVMAGAGEAAPAIFGAYQDVLRDDPKAATTQRRNQGDYRS